MKDSIVNIRITEKLKAKLVRAAKKEGLSISAYLTRLVTLFAK